LPGSPASDPPYSPARAADEGDAGRAGCSGAKVGDDVHALGDSDRLAFDVDGIAARAGPSSSFDDGR
jgi:hypothetical protein